jgi:hypothetical protein
MVSDLSQYLGTVTLAVGALGTASYGVVDGMKLIPWVELAGFERLFSGGGTAGGRMWPTTTKAGLDPLLPTLTAAYGADTMDLLKTQYRAGRAKGDLPRTLRQGVRIGFGMIPTKDIEKAAAGLGVAGDVALLAAGALELTRQQRPPAAGEAPKALPTVGDEQRAALARLETAIDARIDAALALAEMQYITQTKVLAMIVALVIAFGVGLYLGQDPALCFMVGIAAVPLAPVAKDLATALQEAVKVFRAR